jgi:hypothetical protein
MTTEEEIIYDAMVELLPDTFQVLGDEKLRHLAADTLAGEISGNADFLPPEYGHPTHFMEHIKLAIEASGLFVTMLKAINRMYDILERDSVGNDPVHGGEPTRRERLYTALVHLIRNIK